jgi:hypothetical protein
MISRCSGNAIPVSGIVNPQREVMLVSFSSSVIGRLSMSAVDWPALESVT